MPYKNHDDLLASRSRYREKYRERIRIESLEYSRTERGRRNIAARKVIYDARPDVIAKRLAHSMRLAEWALTTRSEKRRAYASTPEARAKNLASNRIRRQKMTSEQKEMELLKRRKAYDKVDGAARSRRWYALNKEKAKDSAKAWLKAHPEAKRINKLNRKMRKRVNGGGLSSGVVKRLLESQRGVCVVCLEKLTDYHIDHNIPLALGGEHKEHNVQLLCPQCNMEKGAKHPTDFMQERGFLI